MVWRGPSMPRHPLPASRGEQDLVTGEGIPPSWCPAASKLYAQGWRDSTLLVPRGEQDWCSPCVPCEEKRGVQELLAGWSNSTLPVPRGEQDFCARVRLGVENGRFRSSAEKRGGTLFQQDNYDEALNEISQYHEAVARKDGQIRSLEEVVRKARRNSG